MADKDAVSKGYALPPPSQVQERAAKGVSASVISTPAKGATASTSTPGKPVHITGSALDKQID